MDEARLRELEATLLQQHHVREDAEQEAHRLVDLLDKTESAATTSTKGLEEVLEEKKKLVRFA